MSQWKMTDALCVRIGPRMRFEGGDDCDILRQEKGLVGTAAGENRAQK